MTGLLKRTVWLRRTRAGLERRSQQGTNAFGVFVPLAGLCRKTLTPRFGQFVPLATTASGIVPLTADQLVRFQAVQQRVQSSGLDVDQAATGVAQIMLQQVSV